MITFVLHYEISLRATVVVIACSMSVLKQLHCVVRTVLMKSAKTSCLLLISVTVVHVTPIYEGGW